ncbi:MAG: class I SAM-dependent methyltransferase [Xanthomonadales bacterium]|nr:class I SAM-dependent methyltransferase [Xanthomonadales bacterium]
MVTRLIRRFFGRATTSPTDDSGPGIPLSQPLGHFYSPLVDPASLNPERLWPAQLHDPAGIDFNDAGHAQLLDEWFPRFLPAFDYPEHGDDESEAQAQFHVRNSQFSWLDARALFVLLQAWRPRQVIEVGSGYSTLLMADVNKRFLAGRAAITAIEPYPRPFLHSLGGVQLLEQKIQEVDPAVFDSLGENDILFIDSSHVAKTGSDVNHLFFQVLPRLRPGVKVHVHDVFLPAEYPREWVLDENRSWNEQYMLQALLMYSRRFRIVFGSMYAHLRYPERLQRALGRPGFGGGSLWLEVMADPKA